MVGCDGIANSMNTEFEQTPGDGDRRGSPGVLQAVGLQSDTTERLNNNKNNLNMEANLNAFLTFMYYVRQNLKESL